MPYCTQSDLLKLIPEKELAQLTAETGDTPDAAVVAEAIAKADGEINGFMGRRYQTPLSPVPDLVRSLSVDMAIYHLHSRRSLAPEVRRQKYEDAVKFLKAVSLGQAVVDGAAGVEAPAVQQEVTEINSQTRVFDREKMGDW